ncbi:hypothetical protein [Marinicella litoralis]|uniref:Uncharacterized protein n=1 Tax=Marinicella litoralis TaxID=644220 RepID=A0A4R6XZB4_9GAMM|nr:hypothetical protein [Marinicella litoralis]TDR23890.1 hypothetical protein C8D91_0757 [Marinicella litoralis]
MTEILLGLLIGLLLTHALRLKSWVVSMTLLLLTSSVLAAELTAVHAVMPFVSVLLLLAVNVLLNQNQFAFGDLLALNLLLLFHVIAGYVSPHSILIIISLFALVYTSIRIIRKQAWLNALLLLLMVLWSLLVEPAFWHFMAYAFWILLLFKQQHQLISDQQFTSQAKG